MEVGAGSTFSDLAGLASFAAVALSSNPLIEIPVNYTLRAGDYQTNPCQRLKGPHWKGVAYKPSQTGSGFSPLAFFLFAAGHSTAGDCCCKSKHGNCWYDFEAWQVNTTDIDSDHL